MNTKKYPAGTGHKKLNLNIQQNRSNYKLSPQLGMLFPEVFKQLKTGGAK